MTRTRFTNRIATLVVAALVVTSLMAIPVAATTTVDTEASTTSHQSDVTQDATIFEEFNASSNSVNLEVNSTIDDDDIELRLKKNGSSVVYHTDSSPENLTVHAGSGRTHFNFTVTESDLERVPMDINENVTIDFEVWNTSDDADADDPEVNVQAFIENTDDRAVVRIDDDSDDTDDGTDGRIIRDDIDWRTIETDNVDVVGGNTTVYFTLEESTNDEFDNATEDLSDDSWTLMQATAEDDPYPMFLDDVGQTFEVWGSEEWDLEDHGSYFTYDADEDWVTFVASDEDFDTDADGEEADIEIDTRAYGFIDAIRDFGPAGATRLASTSVGL